MNVLSLLTVSVEDTGAQERMHLLPKKFAWRIFLVTHPHICGAHTFLIVLEFGGENGLVRSILKLHSNLSDRSTHLDDRRITSKNAKVP